MSNKENTMTIDEARKLMNCSPEFVKQCIRKGRLPGCWVEGKTRDNFCIPREAFMKFLTEWNSNVELQSRVYELTKAVDSLQNSLIRLSGMIDDQIKKVDVQNLPSTEHLPSQSHI